MADKITIYCGRYNMAVHRMGHPHALISQGVETGQEMITKSRYELLNTMAEIAGDTYRVFTNNDHYLNGIRLAIKDGTLDPSKVDIQFFNDRGDHIQLFIAKNGTISHWPRGFFDAWDDALNDLLS